MRTRDLAFDRLRTLLDIPQEQTLRLTTPVTSIPVHTPDAQIDAVSRIPVQQATERVVAARDCTDRRQGKRLNSPAANRIVASPARDAIRNYISFRDHLRSGHEQPH